jgi:hypothetical protein
MLPYNKFQNQLQQGQKYELEALKYLDYDRYEHDTNTERNTI